MNCIVCNRYTGENGDHYAVYEDTTGNYGSRVLDMERTPVRVSICDWCLVERRDRLRLVKQDRCEACCAKKNFWSLIPTPEDDDLLKPEHLEGYIGPPSSGSAGGASPNLHQP